MWQSWKHTWGCFSSIITSCLTRLPSGLHSIHCSGMMWNGHGGQPSRKPLSLKDCLSLHRFSSTITWRRNWSWPVMHLSSGLGLGCCTEWQMVWRKQVGFVSHTLAPAEKGYSQLGREGLVVMLGVKKCPHYVYGLKSTIVTDQFL